MTVDDSSVQPTAYEMLRPVTAVTRKYVMPPVPESYPGPVSET